MVDVATEPLRPIHYPNNSSHLLVLQRNLKGSKDNLAERIRSSFSKNQIFVGERNNIYRADDYLNDKSSISLIVLDDSFYKGDFINCVSKLYRINVPLMILTDMNIGFTSEEGSLIIGKGKYRVVERTSENYINLLNHFIFGDNLNLVEGLVHTFGEVSNLEINFNYGSHNSERVLRKQKLIDFELKKRFGLPMELPELEPFEYLNLEYPFKSN